MCRSSFSLCVLFILLLCPIQGIALEGFEIVGVGTNPAAALRDGIRQIGEIFGGVKVFSDSEVQDFVLKADRITTSSKFAGSKLDRFYRGLQHRDGLWYARFLFPREFVRSVQSRQRTEKTAKLSASWDVIEYRSRTADDFGEVREDSIKIRIPAWYLAFVQRYLGDTDKVGPADAAILTILGILISVLTIWIGHRRYRFPLK